MNNMRPMSQRTRKHVLTREELDRACDDDNILSLTAKCHPSAAFYVHYDRATGTILTHCADCGKYVDAIAVRAVAMAK